jgi:hypothetical protein
MAPAGLDHADLGIGKEMDRLHEEVGRRDEIGVEDEDELAGAGIETALEGAGLEAGAVHAVDVLDVEAFGPEALDLGLGDVAGFVGGIVENLDLEEVFRVIELGDAIEEALDDVELVKDGELDGDAGEGIEVADGAWDVFAMLEEEVNDDVTVNAVHAEAKENGEVADSPNEVSGSLVHSLVLNASSEAG